MPDKQREANRRNALRSTGPKTAEGVEGCKMNAFRHGLRAVQTVVPGENSDDWEAHRAAIVDDLGPVGAMETALAEQVAAEALATRPGGSFRSGYHSQCSSRGRTAPGS